VLERVEKNAKKGKNFFFKFYVYNKFQSVTHDSASTFEGLFKNMVVRSAALGIKKLWAILDFFKQTGLFTALYPTLCIKKFKFFK